jgi:MYXO-CTERM domain-containing protein
MIMRAKNTFQWLFPLAVSALTILPARSVLAGAQPSHDNGPIDRATASIDVEGAVFEANSVRQRRSALGLDIWWGRAPDPRFDDLANYVNVILVGRPGEEGLIGSFEDERGLWRLRGDFGSPLRARLESAPEDRALCGHEGAQLEGLAQPIPLGSDDGDGACGITYLDMFMGFTINAAAETSDLESEATLITEMTNTGLFNSQVEGIQVRLVGTGTTATDLGVTVNYLGMVESLMGGEAYALGADLIGIVATNQGFAGEAGGYAWMPGQFQVVLSGLTTAWRHEVGHSVGGNHCVTEGIEMAPYAFGYDPGNGLSTHQCGNATNFYSTPWVQNQGVTIGNAATADMGRMWEERAALMSMHRTHVIDFPPCTPDSTGPEVAITAPTSPAEYVVTDVGSEQTVNVAAEASDAESGIQSVRLLINGVEAAGSEDLVAPYAWPLGLPVGEYEVIAVATDTSSNESMSAPLMITVVEEGQPPGGDSGGDESGASSESGASTESGGGGEGSTGDTGGTETGFDDTGLDDTGYGSTAAGDAGFLDGGAEATSGCACEAAPSTPPHAFLTLLTLFGLRRRQRSRR